MTTRPNPRAVEIALELITAHMTGGHVRISALGDIYAEFGANPQLHADVTNTLALIAFRFALDASEDDVERALDHTQALALRLYDGLGDAEET